MSRITYSAPPAPSIVVGIDPGLSLGFALWDAEAGRLREVTTTTFWDAARRLARAARLDPCPVDHVVVEDARALPVYHRNRHANRGQRDRIARSVGQIDAQVRLLVERCERLGLDVVLIEPSRAKKWDAEEFERLTGWTGPTNEHGRDAARLVFGREPKKALQAAES